MWDTPDTMAFPTLDPLNDHSNEWRDAGSCWDNTIGSALDWMSDAADFIGNSVLGQPFEGDYY